MNMIKRPVIIKMKPVDIIQLNEVIPTDNH